MCRQGRGELSPARSGVAWQSPALHRGLYTRVAGVWQNDSGRRLELAADTLLWSESSAGAMIFDARSSAKDPPGYWLGYDPGQV